MQISFEINPPELFRNGNLTLVHFSASWAEQCKHMNDIFSDMSQLDEYKSVKYAAIEAEEFPQISLNCGITAAPTIVFFKNGNIIDRVDGVKPAVVQEKITKHLSQSSAPIPPSEVKEPLEARLKKLVNQSECMLFMKGDPETPRCGFSKTIISILNDCNADYKTFDILKDMEVREGLKKFSNWPTYPQLYIKGELMGGLDIVKEMNDTGELKDMLPKKQ